MDNADRRTSMRRRLAYRALPSAIALLVLALSAPPAPAKDEPLVLLVQPATGQENGEQAYAAFADYLTRTLGRPCIVQAPPNYVVHWEWLKRNNYDLALD